MTDRRTTAFADATEADVRDAFDAEDYVADDDVVTTVLLALRLGKPLLVEGEPGAGKTELAKVLAAGFGAELVRLQCYEGLTAESALYEWNYTKQLLAVQGGSRSNESGEGGKNGEGGEHGESVFTEEYLLERPLLRALRGGSENRSNAENQSNGESRDNSEGRSNNESRSNDESRSNSEYGGGGGGKGNDGGDGGDGGDGEGATPPVLLIDEVDRADEEFEALLLEVLSDFQVSVPELGTVRAATPPVVVITSNRTRGLSDALKRRCLYLHVSPPSFEKERAILARKVPELDAAVAAELCAAAHRLREEPLRKPPGAAETIDWARAVAALRTNGNESLTTAEVEQTLGCLLKEAEDIERVDDSLLADLLEAASEARASADATG